MERSLLIHGGIQEEPKLNHRQVWIHFGNRNVFVYGMFTDRYPGKFQRLMMRLVFGLHVEVEDVQT